MKAKERGDDAERRVHDFLVGRGLEPLGRNWSRRLGELDLIFRERTPDGPVIVFVEVRYRRHRALGGGLESVDARKRVRLRRAARAWLQRHGDPDHAARIDVIAVGPHGTRAATSHDRHPSGDRGAVREGRSGAAKGPPAEHLVPLGPDARGRPLALQWIVSAVAEDD